MNRRDSKLTFLVFVLLACAVFANRSQTQTAGSRWKPEIPRTWVDSEIEALELPLADPASSPKHISADYYYRIPVRPLYKSYPIYAPGKEAAGYLDQLKKLEPEIQFDASKLRTEQDWIKAGELVFEAPVAFVSSGSLFSEVRGLAWYQKNGVLTTRDGIFPNMRYVVREKGNEYGLDLSDADRKALIAFLKTL